MSISIRHAAAFAAASLLSIGLTTPLLAHAAHGNTSDGGRVTYDAKTGRYCIFNTYTGSNIAQVTCKSKEDWAADGLTISGR
jgi:hypothetical protein